MGGGRVSTDSSAGSQLWAERWGSTAEVSGTSLATSREEQTQKANRSIQLWLTVFVGDRSTDLAKGCLARQLLPEVRGPGWGSAWYTMFW